MQRYIFPRTPPSIYPILTRRGLLHIAVLVDQRQHILVLVSSIFKDGFCKRAFYLVSAFLMHFQRCLVRHKDMGLNAVDVALVEHIVGGDDVEGDKQVVEQQEHELPLHEGLVVALQLLPHAHARRVEVAVAQQHATDEEEAGHVEHIYESAHPLRTPRMSHNHQDDTHPLGHVERQVAWLLRVLCHVYIIFIFLKPRFTAPQRSSLSSSLFSAGPAGDGCGTLRLPDGSHHKVIKSHRNLLVFILPYLAFLSKK